MTVSDRVIPGFLASGTRYPVEGWVATIGGRLTNGRPIYPYGYVRTGDYNNIIVCTDALRALDMAGVSLDYDDTTMGPVAVVHCRVSAGADEAVMYGVGDSVVYAREFMTTGLAPVGRTAKALAVSPSDQILATVGWFERRTPGQHKFWSHLWALCAGMAAIPESAEMASDLDDYLAASGHKLCYVPGLGCRIEDYGVWR